MELKLNDTVQFTHIARKGRTVSMTNKTGKIVELDHTSAIVLVGKHSRYRIDLERLRKAGQRSHLTEFAERVFEANRKQ